MRGKRARLVPLPGDEEWRPSKEPLGLGERFWRHVAGPWLDASIREDCCWWWTGSRGQSRRPKYLEKSRPYRVYGRFWLEGKLVGAHRVALLLVAGQPPSPGHVAAHRCDQPLCCNPRHLFWASPATNIADAVDKGRLGRARGRWASTSLEATG